jgi:hypothetical protein
MPIIKATWAWVKGKSEEAMREVLGAGRDVRKQAGEVETPAMAAEARCVALVYIVQHFIKLIW